MEFNTGIERYADGKAYAQNLLSLWSQKVAERMQLKGMAQQLIQNTFSPIRKMRVTFA